jgi:hypothetical protein
MDNNTFSNTELNMKGIAERIGSVCLKGMG